MPSWASPRTRSSAPSNATRSPGAPPSSRPEIGSAMAQAVIRTLTPIEEGPAVEIVETVTKRHAAVQVRNFSRAFGDTVVLRELNLEIRQGEFIALLGRSGSGKTTLLRTLAGLDPADAQSVRTPIGRAVVFQEPRLMPWMRIWRNVAIGLGAPEARERARAALVEVGLAHRLDVWPFTL